MATHLLFQFVVSRSWIAFGIVSGAWGEEARSSGPKQNVCEFIPNYFENEKKERNSITGRGNKATFIKQ